jgi:glycine cleavage system H protein
MTEMKFTRDHEYVRVADGVGTIGITNYAQEKLGDIVFVDLPGTGKVLVKGQEMAVVESVKAYSEVYSPVGGEVVEINEAIVDTPTLVNEDAESEGWFVKIRLSDMSELSTLMSADAYADYLETVD